MPSDPHKPYDRGIREVWANTTDRFIEVLLGRTVPAGTRPEQTQLESSRELFVDGLASDGAGGKIHVEWQTRADYSIGWRMARYHVALHTNPKAPAPEHHLLLLHPDAEIPGLGHYDDGVLQLRYRVVRLWNIDPERLLAHPWLDRLAPLADAPSPHARVKLLERALQVMHTRQPAHEAGASAVSAGLLANLYIDRDIIDDVLKRSHMPLDLSHTQIVVQARDEGLREGQRETLRRVLTKRFADAALTSRVTAIPDTQLLEAIDLAAAGTATEFTAWLDSLAR